MKVLERAHRTRRRTWDADFDIAYHTHLSKLRTDPRVISANAEFTLFEKQDGQPGPLSEPYPLSQISAATAEGKDTVKVMVHHGLTYAHHGLSDPDIMPGSTALSRHVLSWTDCRLGKTSSTCCKRTNGTWEPKGSCPSARNVVSGDYAQFNPKESSLRKASSVEGDLSS